MIVKCFKKDLIGKEVIIKQMFNMLRDTMIGIMVKFTRQV